MSSYVSDEQRIKEMEKEIPIGTKVKVSSGDRYWHGRCVEHKVRFPKSGGLVRYSIVMNTKNQESHVNFEDLERV